MLPIVAQIILIIARAMRKMWMNQIKEELKLVKEHDLLGKEDSLWWLDTLWQLQNLMISCSLISFKHVFHAVKRYAALRLIVGVA